MFQPDGVQVCDLAVIRLGFLKPDRIDLGLVFYLYRSFIARSYQARLPIAGKDDDHGIPTVVGAIVVY